MPVDSTALIVASIALIAAILAPIITGINSAKQARQERKETRRKAREDYLRELARHLVEIRAELQYLHDPPKIGNNSELERERETLYGKAYGLMLLSGEKSTQFLAEKVMTESPGNPKLQVINEAIRNLAKHADEIASSDP